MSARFDGMGIGEIRTAPRSPWQNGYAERVIGSIRRECFDYVIVLNESGLRRVLHQYVDYYTAHVLTSASIKTRLLSDPLRNADQLSQSHRSADSITVTIAARRNRSLIDSYPISRRSRVGQHGMTRTTE
jgi:transposase InsO family protein